MAIRSLHQSYKVPAGKLESIDVKASAKKRREFLKKWDVRQYMLEDNPQLQHEVGISKQQ